MRGTCLLCRSIQPWEPLLLVSGGAGQAQVYCVACNISMLDKFHLQLGLQQMKEQNTFLFSFFPPGLEIVNSPDTQLGLWMTPFIDLSGNTQCNPLPACSEVCPIEVHGVYFQKSVHRMAASRQFLEDHHDHFWMQSGAKWLSQKSLFFGTWEVLPPIWDFWWQRIIKDPNLHWMKYLGVQHLIGT